MVQYYRILWLDTRRWNTANHFLSPGTNTICMFFFDPFSLVTKNTFYFVSWLYPLLKRNLYWWYISCSLVAVSLIFVGKDPLDLLFCCWLYVPLVSHKKSLPCHRLGPTPSTMYEFGAWRQPCRQGQFSSEIWV